MVSPVTFYQPAVLARIVATVDQLASGRVDLGLGAGWSRWEHERNHIDFGPLPERVRRLEDTVRMMHDYWSNNRTRPAFGSVWLVLGGNNDRILRIVAQNANEWNMVGIHEAIFGERSARLNRYAIEAGRRPREITRSILTGYLIGRNRNELAERAVALREVMPALEEMDAAQILEAIGQEWVVGTPPQIAHRLRKVARLGVDLFLFDHYLMDDADALGLLASEVMPAIT